MEARMKNPAMVLDAVPSIQEMNKAIYSGGVPPTILELVHLRASQINGCAACVDSGTKGARRAGESEERLFAVSVWRDSPLFTDAERAALALAESATRLADTPDAVPDQVWETAAEHFDERGLASLVLMIALTNFYNRLNVTTKQVPGAWG
ncbi:carboxymuconolactone decarboxylase family protein [Actinoallomurus soli]|uniref:carboxymuconolactone decarboxylase family protein n=1 Tax=Actinoallomurus soli TaxID=2952535 RepID=UPI00209353CC|nr:carboxymuconolactone decarboxylase family protein [Actinoallomurus soli]MCO5967414.1 carboxymuconolactone decarboxylase family protein [Actinoallomurus soli]